MKKKLIIFAAFIVVMIGLQQWYMKKGILSSSLENVKSVEIIYGGLTKSYDIEKDKEFIDEVYGCIYNTTQKVHKNNEDFDIGTGNPAFTINIHYKNGKNDVIKSNEIGTNVFRIIDKKGSWVGGENTKLLTVVKDK